jgi:FkbM family methyltransferase
MEIGGRSVKKVVKALFQGQHYTAFLRSFLVYTNPFKQLKNYLLSTGTYPSQITLKSGYENVHATLFGPHDLLTVNEIFCRHDYPCDKRPKFIVDIGSNIGISALYFLSRNPQTKMHLFEPNPSNLVKLRINLAGHDARVVIHEDAVADENAVLEFGIEETGRYGGLKSPTQEKIKVNCVHINDVLSKLLKENNVIDILKLDTEGSEIDTLNAISPQHLTQIENIYFEEGIEERIDLLSPSLFESHRLSRKGNSYYLTAKQKSTAAKSE